MPPRTLRIVADDFGVNADRTDGILAAAAVLSHTSLLVCGNDTQRAVSAALTASSRASCMTSGEGRRPLHAGLHFNITEGAPLRASRVSANPLVNQQTGRFLGKAGVFQLLHGAEAHPAAAFAALVDAIVEQLETQVEFFMQALPDQDGGRLVMDGHHHVQCIPIVRHAINTYLSTSKYTLRYLRRPHDCLLEPVDDTRFLCNEDCFGMPFWRRISQLSASATLESPSDSHQFQWPTAVSGCDGFIGFDLMGSNMTAGALRRKIQLLPDDVVHLELMTHLGRPTAAPEGDTRDDGELWWCDQFSSDVARLHELQTICSSQFAEMLVEEHVALLIGWET